MSPSGLPRLGFLGLGWIGRSRMASLLEAGAAEAVALADPDPVAVGAAAELAPGAARGETLAEVLAAEPGGVVIATPSAGHAEQALAALAAGVAVFCQKPLARTAAETERVLAAARAAARPLGVDLSYRRTAAAERMRRELAAGTIGPVYAVELVFHNAYGPDTPWFADRARSGGGCVIDLATHLVDLALWLTGAGSAEVRAATLRRAGEPVPADGHAVEDFALAELALRSGDDGGGDDGGEIPVRLACSWFLPAGRECAIEVTLLGPDGALSLQNVGGSFYDFTLERRVGTAAETLVAPPDAWGGRALIAWARRLGDGEGFDERGAAEHLQLARAIDGIYACGFAPAARPRSSRLTLETA